MGVGMKDTDDEKGHIEEESDAEPEKTRLNPAGEEDIELRKIPVKTKDSEYPEIVSPKSKSYVKKSLLKYSLIAFNFCLALLGIVILALAVWIKADGEFWEYDTTLDIDDYYKVCYIFMVAGLVILIIAFLGCCGAVVESQWMLGVYFFVFAVLFLMELTALIIVWHAPYNKQIEKALQDQIKRQIDDRVKSEPARHFTDFVQAQLECCGSVNEKDYYTDIPKSCTNLRTGSINTEGCAKAMLKYLQTKSALVGGIGVPIVLLHASALIVSMCLLCNIRQASRYIM